MLQSYTPRQRATLFARLLAVQSLYAFHFSSDQSLEEVLENILHSKDFWGIEIFMDLKDEDILKHVDQKLSLFLFKGAVKKSEELNACIAKHLTKDWSLDRLDLVMLCLLKVALFELFYREEVPYKVVISEYIKLASFFFEEDELKFINAILDQAAKAVIKGEE